MAGRGCSIIALFIYWGRWWLCVFLWLVGGCVCMLCVVFVLGVFGSLGVWQKNTAKKFLIYSTFYLGVYLAVCVFLN